MCILLTFLCVIYDIFELWRQKPRWDGPTDSLTASKLGLYYSLQRTYGIPQGRMFKLLMANILQHTPATCGIQSTHIC